MIGEEIIELALQCGIWIPLASGPEREQTIDRLLRLAALVASAERGHALKSLTSTNTSSSREAVQETSAREVTHE